MKRRTVLKVLAGGSMIGQSLMADNGLRRQEMGKVGSPKKLVVCFHRGGNDGLNSMVPVDPVEYNRYSNLRPTIGLSQGSLTNIPGESFFALHPGLAPLVPIISAGNCSLIHAVGYPNPDRSHFESQSFYETAVPGNGLLDGWLNRYLRNTTGPGLIRGVSIGSNIPQSVAGSLAVPVSHNFGLSNIEVDYSLNDPDSDSFRQAIRDTLTAGPTAGNEEVYDTGNQIFQMIDSFQDRNLNDYTPENGATYPNTNFGNRVMHAAQMLKDDTNFLGVEVVTLDQYGFDTHANQVSAGNPATITQGHGYLMNQLALSMAAFYTDMGPTRMDDILFLVVSEFGRRAFQNNSVGTDHGTGSLVFVMGNAVNGNIINGGGDFPGLASADLVNGDLDWVTDFRDIYWDILTQHMGADMVTADLAIPGHGATPVGFL